MHSAPGTEEEIGAFVIRKEPRLARRLEGWPDVRLVILRDARNGPLFRTSTGSPSGQPTRFGIGGPRPISEFPKFRLTPGENQQYSDSVPAPLRGGSRS